MPVELTFPHCNPRRHTLALIPAPMPKRLDHFMLQVDSMEDVGLAYDRAERIGVRIVETLGRHTNDHMFSFYAYTPSGLSRVRLGRAHRRRKLDRCSTQEAKRK